MKRLAKFDLAVSAAVFATALALYVRTVAPTVLGGDSGEFQFAAPMLGLAHPTGYPLYLLLGKLFTYLPLGDAAYRVNLFSAVAAAFAVAMTYLGGISISPTAGSPARLGGLLAAALFAASYELWSQAVVAEVYALQLALLSLTFLAVLRGWRLELIALLAGLSLAHHRATVLTLPVFALYLLATRRAEVLGLLRGFLGRRTQMTETGKVIGPRQSATALAALLLPLLLYLYVPLRGPATSYLHQVTGQGQRLDLYANDLESFVDQITGRVFASKLGAESPTGFEDRLELFRRLAARQWSLPGLVYGLGAAGAVALLVRRPAVGVLLGSIGAITVAFGLLYRIGDIEVYFIPFYWSVALGAGFALTYLTEMLYRPLPRMAVVPVGMAAIAVMVLPSLFVNFSRNDRSGEWDVRRRWEAIFAGPVEPGAVLASDDRDEMTPFWYLQSLEGKRPDLSGAFPGMFNRPDYANVGRVVDQLLAAKEKVYLVKGMPGIEVKYQIEPAGQTFKVTGPANGGAPSTLLETPVGDSLVLTGIDLPPAADGDHIDVRLWWLATKSPAENYTTFVHLIDAQGRLAAQSDAPPGGVFYPTGRWLPGEKLVDNHRLGLPAGTPAGRYTVRVGAYDEDLKRLPAGGSDAVDVGSIRIAGAPVGSQPQVASGIHFAGVGAFEGLSVVQGQKLQLFWKADGPAGKAYTIFVHVLAPDGSIVRQADGPPAGGALPTDSWLPGERVLDERQIAGAPLAPGAYRVRVGLYDPATGVRTLTDTGQDSIELPAITFS